MTKNITTNSNRRFPLFQSHIDLAHSYWSQILEPGEIAVDATSGNGHDTLFLAKKTLTASTGTIYAIDIQQEALQKTQKKIETELPDVAHRVRYLHQSHEVFPESFQDLSIKLFVYNLGYLPGADKTKTTVTASTLSSIRHASELVAAGGLISITCYPGHPEGALEEEALLKWAMELDNEVWNVCHHRWVNRMRSPSLLLLQKTETLA